MKLNVATEQTTRYGAVAFEYVGYIVLNGCAVRLCSGADLSDLRYYAEVNGYDGILLGSPSVPWGRIVRI